MNFIERVFYKNKFYFFNQNLRHLGFAIIGYSLALWVRIFVCGKKVVLPVEFIVNALLSFMLISICVDFICSMKEK